MTTEQTPNYPANVAAIEPQVRPRITVGAAIKIGFFGAFGALLFSLLLSVVLGILAVIFGAAMIPVIQELLGF